MRRLPCKKVKTFNAKTPGRKVAKFCKLNGSSGLSGVKTRFTTEHTEILNVFLCGLCDLCGEKMGNPIKYQRANKICANRRLQAKKYVFVY